MSFDHFFWSSVVPSKIPVTSLSMADVLVSINTSMVASPAHDLHQKERSGDEYCASPFGWLRSSIIA